MFIKREKSCGALVFRQMPDKTELLLLKHKNGGHWSFPKGHVEGTETEIQTALREVKEETGLDIELQDGYKEKVSYAPKFNVKKEVVYFLGKAGSQEPVPQEGEISETKWVDIMHAEKIVTYQNDKYLIRQALRTLNIKGEYGKDSKASLSSKRSFRSGSC